MWHKHKIWIIVGGLLALVVIGGVVENFASTMAVPVVNSVPTTQTVQPTPSVGPLQVQGGTVSDGEYSYKLLPINELTSSGSFATEGRIVRVIPDPITKSHTPYDFVIQNNGSLAVIQVLVPAGEEANFDVNIFPVGTNILAAGAIFPVSSQSGVLDYSMLIQATDVAPALKQLNLPPDTPVMWVNFQDMEIVR